MSARFGRNQRRRMREEIAEAKRAAHDLASRLALYQVNVAELQRRLHRAIEIKVEVLPDRRQMIHFARVDLNGPVDNQVWSRPIDEIRVKEAFYDPDRREQLAKLVTGLMMEELSLGRS